MSKPKGGDETYIRSSDASSQPQGSSLVSDHAPSQLQCSSIIDDVSPDLYVIILVMITKISKLSV